MRDTVLTIDDTPAVTRYSRVAIWLHWVIAAALAGQIALGNAMPRDASGFALYQFHKSVGITILVLSLARLVWRFTHARPAATEGGITGFLAKAVHWGFYAFMILGPLTGWALVSTASVNVPTLIFGVIPLPHLPLGGGSEIWEEAHEILANVGILLFLLHVLGALRHHFLIRDGLLARMAPGGRAGWALLLGAGVVAVWALVPVLVGPPVERTAQDEAAAPIATEDALPVVTPTEPVPVPEASETPAAEESATAAGPPPEWTIRPGGTLRFAIDNSGTAINGSFGTWSGDIAFDPENPATAAITIRVNLASASLGDATQDAMLQGGDFFASAANPTATWRSTSVTALGSGRYRAEGTLSLKGASRAQALTFTLAGTGARRTVTGRASIDRGAFGVGTGPDAAGLAPTVTLDFTFEATS